MSCLSFQFEKIGNENIDEVISVFEEIRAELIREGKLSAGFTQVAESLECF